jgi:hypothetical protein
MLLETKIALGTSTRPSKCGNAPILRRHSRYLICRDYENYAQAVSTDISSSPKKFWSFNNQCRNRQQIPEALSYGTKNAAGSERPNLFLKFFSNCLLPDSNLSITPAHSLPNANHSLSQIQTDSREVFQYLCRIPIHRSPGPDGLNPKFIRNCTSSLSQPLALLFNRCFSVGTFNGNAPTSFRFIKQAPRMMLQTTALYCCFPYYRPCYSQQIILFHLSLFILPTTWFLP